MDYDFSKINSAISLNKEWLFSRISEVQIFGYYWGNFELNRSYCSKIRKDRSPSVAFRISKNGQLYLTDFATGEWWNAISYVRKLYNCDFNNALSIIAKDFGLINRKTSVVPNRIFDDSNKIDINIKKETIIQFSNEKWNQSNLRFWNLFEITQEELEYNNIYPIKELFINKKEIYNKKNELRYAFIVEEKYVKVYCPYSKEMKWITNIPLSMPFNLERLQYKDSKVIITKSLKDTIVLSKLFTDVLGVQNESSGSISKEVENLLLEKFDKRIIFFDNDSPGVDASIKYTETGNYEYFNIPKEEYLMYGVKDASDYTLYYGIEALKTLFLNKNLL